MEFDKNGKMILINSNIKIRHEKWLDELIQEIELRKGGGKGYGSRNRGSIRNISF